MNSDMIGMAVMALMIMLVIGGGTTLVYLAGQRDAHDPTEVPNREQASRKPSEPSASHVVKKPFAPVRWDRLARRRELFLGP
jgi:hypothetical protein